MDKLTELKQKIETYQAKSVLAPELKAFATLILSVVKTAKDNFDSISKENLATIQESIAYIEAFHTKQSKLLDSKSNAMVGQFDAKYDLLKGMLEDIKKIKVVDGKDGKDGLDGLDGKDGKDGENGSPDEAEDIKEKLESLKDENRLDASAIKNLPEFINNKANGGGWRNLYQMHDVSIDSPTNGEVLKYNSTTNVWENGTASGGASAFTDLTDTPANYTGSSLKAVRVNVGETGLEFYTPSSGTGTVTSVDMSVPTGLAISGNPVTTSGTLALALDTGYVIPQQTTLDGFVPYTGATGDVDLGLFDLSATNLTATGDLSVGNVVSDLTPFTDGTYNLGSPTNRYNSIGAISIAFDSAVSLQYNLTDSLSIETLNLELLNNVSNLKAILDTSSIATTDKTFTFPNATGTIALTSDITGTNSGTNTGDQTITNSSDATSHTVTLSASGGSIQFIEGTNITLTTGGTGSVGTVTINASGGSGDALTTGGLTQFLGNNNWKVFYSDGSGDVKELALGADGTFLKSNGVAAAPTFATPAGSGDVSKVGTPVDNQIAVWTGDGTIEGVSNILFDNTTQAFEMQNINDSSNIFLYSANGTETNFSYIDLTRQTLSLVSSDNILVNSSNADYQFRGTSVWGILNFSSVATADKTFTFPNASGTIALTANPTDITVPDEAYGAGWDGSLEVPTKNALYDKIQTLGGGSGITRTITSIAVNTTAGSTASVDYVYFVTGTTTLTLPTAVGNTNRYTVKSISGTTTVACDGAETIDGSATIGIANEDSVDLISNNTEWKVV
jgi:hypothetical protein